MSTELAVFKKPADLMAYLQKSKAAVEMALPKHLNPDRMLRLALTCFSTTPKLRECSGQSILASIVVASQLGLEPGVAGQGYLIPYKTTCTFVPGWQGLVGLLNNSGRATAWTGAVFEGDVWNFQLGSAPKCAHIPGDNYGDPDKLIWVYACGKVNGSEQPVVEAWPMSRVWKHRDRFNKVGRAHYSFTHPEMYARKVVLLQVLKYMPRSIELNNAIVAADAAEIGHSSRVDGGVVVEVQTETQPVQPPPGREEQPNGLEDNIDLTAPNGEEKQPEGPTAPDPIPTEPGELVEYIRRKCASLELDEPQVMEFAKDNGWCGKACKTLSDVASKGLRQIAANIEEHKDTIAAI